MQVYNPNHNEELKPGLKRALANFRAKRNFDPAAYADAKAKLINQYFKDTPLKTAIVALSGGIDSSIVAGLAAHAMKQDGSPIKNILAPTIPAFAKGATGQDDAARRAYDVMNFIGAERLTIDITEPHRVLTETVEKALGITGNDWSKGQSVAHVRTMALAYCATLMQQEKKGGIIWGTTNRSEGAYLGYVGKYSDGMTDVQVISDLFKSEVYALAHHLKLPTSTINAIPKGDMYDSRNDTEVFGASYDFVELYLSYLELSEEEKATLLRSFTSEERKQFGAMANNLEKLHGYNGHKYLGNQPGSPAYHLDILKSGVPGGWQDTLPTVEFRDPPAAVKETMPGFFEMKPEVRELINARVIDSKMTQAPIATTTIDLSESCNFVKQHGLMIGNLLQPDEIQAIVDDVFNLPLGICIPVGEDGMRKSFNLASNDKIGSWRATTFNQQLGDLIWNRLKPIIPAVEHIPAGTSVDAEGTEVWRAVGVNTKFSFIMYRPDDTGNLVTHYDAPFDYGDDRKTLKTLILYFTDAAEGQGGRTRFVKDPQANIPPLERNLDDWTDNATPDQVYKALNPKAGAAFVFNHRVLHDSEPLTPDAPVKLIARSDIVYQRALTP